ncbi:MAG: hypothetical protein HRT88_12605, partial [Lentisphaeraceae bacterium]|nr:hypothetical protein [Lentisphaeraceae bacterium]
MKRRLTIIISLGALALLIVIPFNPVNSKLTNLLFIIALATSIIGPIILSWKIIALRRVLITIPFLLISPLLLPSNNVDKVKLQEIYLT